MRRTIPYFISCVLAVVAAGQKTSFAQDATDLLDSAPIVAKTEEGGGEEVGASGNVSANPNAYPAPAKAPARSGFNALFSTPVVPPASLAADFIGRDPALMEKIDLSPQAAGARANQLRQMEKDFQLQKKGSQPALQLGNLLIKLYEEQAIYLENLRGMGLRDKRYPDLTHFIKTTRSALVNQVNQMIEQFPKSPQMVSWQTTALISRIKIGDPSVVSEARTFIQKHKDKEGMRVQLAGVAQQVIAGKSKGPFGSLDEVANANMDRNSKAAFRLFAAEVVNFRKNPRQAMALYDEAAKLGRGMRTAEGRYGPITLRAIAKMIEIQLTVNADNVDAELTETLKSLRMLDEARFYMEQVALKNIQKQPRRAITLYFDVQELAPLPPQVAASIELRVLDIGIHSRQLDVIETQWQRIAKLPGGMEAPGLESRVVTTQNLTWASVKQKPAPDTVDRFVRLHDFFSARVPSYGESDKWTLQVLEGLAKIQRHESVAERGDALAAKSKTPATQIAALRFSARAREKMLGLEQTPKFVAGKQLRGGAKVSAAYVATLEKLQALVKGPEAETSAFQAAYVTHVTGDVNGGRTRFETSISTYPKGKLASQATSYLLAIAMRARDYAYTEKIARLAESKKIVPENQAHRGLRGIIEIAVFEQARLLESQKKHEEAANKYVAFQKEFPRSKNGPVALDRASKNYTAARKIESSIVQLELLLKEYPSSTFALESRWTAAEQSKSIGQLLRAANHYEAFAKSYGKEGKSRKAMFKAAEMHKGLGRYSHAIANYEIYLKEMPDGAEKIAVAKEIAGMQMKYGKAAEALAAYMRIIQISKKPDDEIWARAEMIEIFQRQGQENLARGEIERVLKLRPTSQDGFRTLARAKFSLGMMESKVVRKMNPNNEKLLMPSLKNLIASYERVKKLFLSACEVPGLEWCSVGYYETARLAEDLAKVVLEVETPPTLDPKEVQPVRQFVAQYSEKLSNESKAYAEQAEEALSIGAPNGDYADRIRAYAQAHRGEQKEDPVR